MTNPASVHLPNVLRRLLALLLLWQERARQRLVLEEMDDYRLRDIGLTRDSALAEARRPFWQGEDRYERILTRRPEGAERRYRDQPLFEAFSETESGKRGMPSRPAVTSSMR